MDKFLSKTLFSTRLMAVLFVVFSVAMIVGTGIESKYSTDTARIWIYNAKWFEAIMVFFVINFSGNIVRYRLYKREKWATLLIHLSFIFIIVGAFITRYISYEGMMPIDEGATEKVFYSEKTYLTVWVDGEINGEPKRRVLQEAILVTPEAIKSSLPWNKDFNGVPFSVSYEGLIDGAKEGLVEDANGKRYLKVVEAGGGSRHDHYLEEGKVSSIHNVLFALNEPTQGAINITINDSISTIESPFEGNFMRMADQLQGPLVKDSVQPLMFRSLYNAANMQFVFPDRLVQGRYDIVEIPKEEKTDNDQDALILNVSANGDSQQVKVMGSKGNSNPPKTMTIGGFDFHIMYGSRIEELPFSITLNDFIAEKYPGTERNPTPSYSAFKSKITVNDERPFDYDIYMNHVLDHKGFRFFQASFLPDEKTTILSVNHDFWGTWITYIGYFLLYAALMAIMFFGKTRFKDLSKMLKKVKEKKKGVVSIALLLIGFHGFSQDGHQHTEDDGHDHSTHTVVKAPSEAEIDSVLLKNPVSKEHAAKFGKLVIQDLGGRMKPANTFASELLRKVSKRDNYKGLNADQVLLSMTENTFAWYNAPLIYLKWQNDSIRKLIGAEGKGSRLSLTQFFTEKGEYKLAPYLQAAYQAKVPNSYQKDIIDTDRRVNLLYSALDGSILRVFPVPGDENNTWVSYPELDPSNIKGTDSLYVKNILPLYATALRNARKTGDYKQTDELLESVKAFQKKYGSEVLPSEQQIETEVLYNKLNIFNKLYRYYGMFGLLLFVFLIMQIFKDRKWLRIAINSGKAIIIALFLAHTAGLLARWYISGHAPWSNGYEAIIYVAWATMGFGLAFIKKSNLTLAGSAFVTSILLWVAHQSWTDPEIANLQAVLDSYWLMIHVAVIVASYGPFTLGAILGITCLLLILLTNKENKKRMKLNIEELSIINELSLTVGLVMLTIGNFLGGQWANESWGRYWGWDPKETWALISIFVYAFVIHMRLVPGLRGRFAFNMGAIIAFMSIIFTYFGVNFILSGLHSYASGDAIIGIPFFVWYTVIFAAIGAAVYPKYRKYYRK
ncbi:cytochrome c biogenesis protein CcsA [Sungkyunkwania multivorans]|uniref:Cytochrome c biogenesis protein CcsA n=1 Tax=Sungkyunkwania multivorans TaxID=1173618 RepID=A0ABW3CVL8_9FLAO